MLNALVTHFAVEVAYKLPSGMATFVVQDMHMTPLLTRHTQV